MLPEASFLHGQFSN